ncbi:hypothetical protein [Streptomyces sp. CC224B]|uniref:hypothetical protein n=1 Tax=Streptomyces sp. CC224B TaxID=3044571 RepID=UPI0024A7AEC4|nr:hypothetical protein [Streptomyces sp. CC224B]
MDDETIRALAELGLTQKDLEAYAAISAGATPPRRWTPHRLLNLGLIEDSPEGYIACDPRAAVRRLLTAEHEMLSRTVQRLALLPALEQLAAHFEPHRMYSGPGSEFLPTGDEMNTRIGEILKAATRELCTAQPAPPEERDPSVRQMGRQRGRAAVSHGVVHRALYNSAALKDEATAEYVAELLEAGGEARVTAARMPRMVIVDGAHLFIDNVLSGEHSEPDAGWHVTDRAIVAWARSVYDMFWWQATRWQDLAPAASDATSTQLQRRILRELEAGASQSQVGPRLGLAERSVHKALADLREALGMMSIYQVMTWWGRTPERELP